MPNVRTQRIGPEASIVPDAVSSEVVAEVLAMSDDECLARLAQALADQDTEHLNEVALLIGRLAVPIE
jgi:hypothetical protein